MKDPECRKLPPATAFIIAVATPQKSSSSVTPNFCWSGASKVVALAESARNTVCGPRLPAASRHISCLRYDVHHAMPSGEPLADEFSDTIAACAPGTPGYSVRILSVVEQDRLS